MASKLLKIGFIGGGKMAQALAKGFITAGLAKGETMISSCHPADIGSVNAFKDLGAKTTFENAQVVHTADIVFLSVKPTIVPIVMADLRKSPDIRTNKLFISVVMGITTRQLEQLLPDEARVVRVMPNAPALVRNGASVFVSGKRATKEDSVITRQLLESVGICEEVPETLVDPITALSGSGPAYIYVLIEALSDGGVKMGIPRDLAIKLAAQTVLGAGRMVMETGTHPGVLKDDATTPAGSTASGLHSLEKNAFRATVINCVEAATLTCKEMSNRVADSIAKK